MPIEKVIVNASPIIVLYKSHLESILPLLFKEILIPTTVYDEITSYSPNDKAALELPDANWYDKIEVVNDEKITAWDLGKGESSILSFALNNPEYGAVIDDKAARRCARVYGISTLGTGSILVLAKRMSIIPSVKKAIQNVRESGLWISDEIANLLIQQANE